MNIIAKIKIFFASKRFSSSYFDIIFILISIVLFFVFLFSWYDISIPFSNKKINKELIKHWIPLFTLFAFIITLYKQIHIEDRLNLQKKQL